MRHLVFALFNLMVSHAISAPPMFSYQGRLFDEAGNPIDNGTSVIRIQIYSPTGNCLLYEENHNVQMEESLGYFRISIGLGSKNTTTAPNLSFEKVFSNSLPLSDVQMGCGTYSPNSHDHRLLRVTIDGEVLSPDQVISSVPFAVQAENTSKLGGKPESDFLQNDGSNVTQSNLKGFFDVVATLGNNQSLRWNSGSSQWDVFTPGAAGSGIQSLTVNSPMSNSGTTNDPVLSISSATTSVAGLMSSADKTKLNSVESNAAADMTAGEIMTALQTVDGAGTGLDADTVDGVQASSFLQSESDPEVGAVTNGQWCRGNGSAVVCDVSPVTDTNTTALSGMSGDSDDIGQGSSNLFLTSAERTKLGSLSQSSLNASDGSPSNALTVDAVGNVGIGMATPKSALQVVGYAQLDVSVSIPPSTDCDNAEEYGRIKVNPTSGDSKLYVCTAGGWTAFAPFGATGTITLIVSGGATRWSNGSYSRSCYEYRQNSNYDSIGGGDSLYWINPNNDGTTIYKVSCTGMASASASDAVTDLTSANIGMGPLEFLQTYDASTTDGELFQLNGDGFTNRVVKRCASSSPSLYSDTCVGANASGTANVAISFGDRGDLSAPSNSSRINLTLNVGAQATYAGGLEFPDDENGASDSKWFQWFYATSGTITNNMSDNTILGDGSPGDPFRVADGTILLSCKNALESPYYSGQGDGVYTIDTDGVGGNAAFDVYCDQTTNGGGWTLAMSAKADAPIEQNYALPTDGIQSIPDLYTDSGTRYTQNINFTEEMYGCQSSGGTKYYFAFNKANMLWDASYNYCTSIPITTTFNTMTAAPTSVYQGVTTACGGSTTRTTFSFSGNNWGPYYNNYNTTHMYCNGVNEGTSSDTYYWSFIRE